MEMTSEKYTIKVWQQPDVRHLTQFVCFFVRFFTKLTEMRPLSMAPMQLIVFVTIFCSLLLTTCSGDNIKCYVCSSSTDVHCTENIDVENTNLKLTDCGGIHDNKFCIKTTGIFNGEMGTTRFCSSEHLGNICDFQRRKGDQRSYRGCIYTCRSDGCNGSSSVVANFSVFFFVAFALILTTWSY